MLTLALFVYVMTGIALFIFRNHDQELSFVERLFLPAAAFVYCSFLVLAAGMFVVLFLIGSVVAIFKR